MATTEIEKLERRYAENPQGLTFAPLAEVHRKNGDVVRALELLRAGLELHPNYIPASIVLGRCHWDLGDLAAAESAFAHVLRLDDENVIALKSLADINERLERFGEAQRWLNRLISVDRSNDEARAQLTRLEAAKQPDTRKPDTTSEPGAPAEPSPETPPVVQELPPAAPVRTEEPAAEEPAPLDLTAAIAEPERAEAAVHAAEKAATESPPLEFIDTSPPAEDAVEPVPLAGLVSQEFVPPKDSTYQIHPELSQEFEPATEPSDQLEVETAEELELRSSGAAEFRVPNAAEDLMDLPMPQAPPEWAEPAAVEPVPPAPEVRRPAYSARETQGQSVASFFEALLTARPPGSPAPSTAARASPGESGAPTRPAQDALTLSSVFGEDNSPTPPAVPASAPSQDAAVSFDDFFGAPATGSSPLPKGSTDPEKDDLDQFQSWLQNLKR
jgi:tetratricopeptide (TPR) repeat protein